MFVVRIDVGRRQIECEQLIQRRRIAQLTRPTWCMSVSVCVGLRYVKPEPPPRGRYTTDLSGERQRPRTA